MKRIIVLIKAVDTPSGTLPENTELEFTRSLGVIYARVPGTQQFEAVTTDNIKRLHISASTSAQVLNYLIQSKSKIRNHENQFFHNN